MSLLTTLRRLARGRGSQERDEAVKKAINRADDVANRVERQVRADRTWDELRRHS